MIIAEQITKGDLLKKEKKSNGMFLFIPKKKTGRC